MMMLAMMATVGTMYAQPGPDSPAMREKAERLKIAFLTERLDLSVEEGQKFWPIYNEFQTDRKEVEKRIRTVKQSGKEGKQSKADVQKAIEEVHAAKRDVIALEEQYLKDALEALGPEKTLALIEAEEKFKREIIRRIQKEREERRDGGRGLPGRR